MHRLFAVFALAGLLATAPVAQVQAQQAPDPAQGPLPMSQFLQQAGYSLSPAEASYLDADQQVQLQWVMPLIDMFGLAGPDAGLPDADTQAKIVADLQQVLALDPNAAPQAPPSLESLRTLAVEQRQALRRAASAWLNALQAGDPDWRTSGTDDFVAAQQSLAAWNQEMFSRYPPPEQPPDQPPS